jgi:hypothetical protein
LFFSSMPRYTLDSKQSKKVFFGPCTLRRTWGTRPGI